MHAAACNRVMQRLPCCVQHVLAEPQRCWLRTSFLFNVRDPFFVLAAHQGDAHARVPRPACTPAAVNVRLRILGRLNLEESTQESTDKAGWKNKQY